MREMLSNAGQAALEVASYGPRMLASFWRPERSRAISLSGPQAALFLLISAVLLTALVVPVRSATPAMVGMSRGPMVILPYQADREVYASTFVSLGAVGVVNALLFLVIGIGSFAALAWCLGGRKEQSLLEIALQLTPPVCAARVASAAVSLIMLRSAAWTELPGIFLLGIAVLFAVAVPYCCWILLRSLKSAANISWTRSIAAFLVGGFVSGLAFQFANPMQLYRIIIAPPLARTAAAEELVASAEAAYGRSEFDSAFENLSESLKIEPNNLFAQTLLIRVYWEQCFAGPECLTAPVWRIDPPGPNRRWKAAVGYYDELRQVYRDVPSVLLHVADTYNFIGACDEAESLYHEVLRSKESLPYERFTAASVLASFTLPEAPEDPLVRAWASPETQIDRIALTVRTTTATAITIRPDVALSDPVLGVDLRHLFSPAPFKERYMTRWIEESPCAHHRRAKWWL
jgi:tetratricopeptide (TPR) repeat protein